VPETTWDGASHIAVRVRISIRGTDRSHEGPNDDERSRWLAVAGLLLLAAEGGNNPTKAKPACSAPSWSRQPTRCSWATKHLHRHAFDTTELVPNPSIHWSTSNAQVFTVSTYAGSAVVHGVGEGSALLIAAAGTIADTAVVLVVSTQTGWFPQTSHTTFQLNDVFFLPDGNTGWAVGEGGTIMKSTNAGYDWTRQVSSTSFSLNGVWFTSATEGWAVGSSHTVLHHGCGNDLDLVVVPVATTSTTSRSPTRATAVPWNERSHRAHDRRRQTWTSQFPTSFTLRSVRSMARATAGRWVTRAPSSAPTTAARHGSSSCRASRATTCAPSASAMRRTRTRRAIRV
jgi:hypothetical protein